MNAADQGQARRAGADLPGQHARVRPDQLVPPPRQLLPLLPDRDALEPRGVHRHDQPGAGPARDPRAALPVPRASTCSTPTRPSSPSSAGWASSRSRTDGAPEPSSARRGAQRALWLLGARAARADRRRSSSAFAALGAPGLGERRGPAGRGARRSSGRPPPRRDRADACATTGPTPSRSRRSIVNDGYADFTSAHDADRPARPPTRSRSTTPGSRARPTRSRC